MIDILFWENLRTEEEKEEWLDALYIAIKSYFERINTLNIGTKVVGKEEPKFEDSTSAKSCSMDKCVNTFKFFSKGCNCISCGKVRSPFARFTILMTLCHILHNH